MREKIIREVILPELPGTMDIIKVDGRWAQVKSPRTGLVMFLDDGSIGNVEWPQFRLARRFDAGVENLQLKCGEKVPDEFLRNAIWDAQDEAKARNGGRSLKGEINVFGEYIRK